MSKAPRAFCTELSHAAGEPLVGTGVHPERNILIRWPKRHWRFAMREADGMSEALRAAIAAAAEAGWRINLIDRKAAEDAGGECVTVYLFPAARRFDVGAGEVAALVRAIAEGADLSGFASRVEPRSLLLVCTHGKHDRCCAKFGFATYKALAAAAEDWPGRFEVWEVTHLGGCRLAASTMVLPELRKYGRMFPRDVAPFLASEARGVPYLPCYRGNSRLPPYGQTAEAAVIDAYGAGPDLPAVTGWREAAGEVLVHVAHRGVTLEVRCRAERFDNAGTCRVLDAEEAVTPRDGWHVVELRQVARA